MGQRSSSLSAPTSHPLLSEPGASPLPQQNIPLATRKVGDPVTPEKRRYPKLKLIWKSLQSLPKRDEDSTGSLPGPLGKYSLAEI